MGVLDLAYAMIVLLIAEAIPICFFVLFTATVLGFYDPGDPPRQGGEEPTAIHRRREIKTDRINTSTTKLLKHCAWCYYH